MKSEDLELAGTRLVGEVEGARPWLLFYRDGKTLGQIVEELGGSVYTYSPWLTAPVIRSAFVDPNSAALSLRVGELEAGLRPFVLFYEAVSNDFRRQPDPQSLVCVHDFENYASLSHIDFRQASRLLSEGVSSFGKESPENQSTTKNQTKDDGSDRCSDTGSGATPLAGQAEKYLALPIYERLALFADAALMSLWEGRDFDGADVQDNAEKYGLIDKVGFDPEVHTDSLGVDPYPGDDWYVSAEDLKALVEAARKALSAPPLKGNQGLSADANAHNGLSTATAGDHGDDGGTTRAPEPARPAWYVRLDPYDGVALECRLHGNHVCMSWDDEDGWGYAIALKGGHFTPGAHDLGKECAKAIEEITSALTNTATSAAEAGASGLATRQPAPAESDKSRDLKTSEPTLTHPVGGWRPIETAPEGETVLLYFPAVVSRAHRQTRLAPMYRVDRADAFPHRSPTHYQPLDAPPTEQTEGG